MDHMYQPRYFTKSQELLGLLFFMTVCFGVSIAGGMITASSLGDWYAALNKPTFNPPNWVFGPVWTILYALMAIASWRIWRIAGLRGAKIPLFIFGLQLALNLAWSMFFFGMRSINLALADIVLLLIAIITTASLFFRKDLIGGLLFIPYIAWVAFATVLNTAIWLLN